MKTLILILAAIAALTLTSPAQSILTEQPSAPEKAAQDLTAGIQASKRAMLGELRHNISLVWDAPDPQAVIDELGTKAGEAFWLSNELATFLTTIMTAANDTSGLAELAAILAKVQPVTVNQDGTVTVNPPEEP
jgi:hypothetical protein